MRAGMTEAVGVELDEATIDELGLVAEDMAGDLTLTFDAGRYEILRDGEAEPLCVGSYTLQGATIRLGAERGSWCEPYTLFEASYHLAGDRLHLGEDGLTGPWWEEYTWTSRPLVRQE